MILMGNILQEDNVSGIYKITNNINSKIYIGSSVNLKKRFSSHISDLKNKKHRNIHLQRAWGKYGEDAFEFKILEYISDKEELLKWEQFYMDRFNVCDDKIGYNINPCAGSRLGTKHSAETRKLMTGRKRSAEHSRKLSESLKGKRSTFYGKKHTEEAKLKIRLGATGIHLGEKGGTSKLTNEKVREIKIILRDTTLTHSEIGDIFNVHLTSIINIRTEKTWKHIIVDESEKLDDITMSYYRGIEAKLRKKLFDEEVKQIRIIVRDKLLTRKEIAELFNVDTFTIGRISRNESRKNIEISENDTLEEKYILRIEELNLKTENMK